MHRAPPPAAGPVRPAATPRHAPPPPSVRRRFRAGLAAVLLGFAASPIDAAPSPALEGSDAQTVDPCEIVTDSLLIDFFGIDPEEMGPDRRSTETYSSCAYQWQAEAMREMEVGGRTIEVPDENEVTLTLAIPGDAGPRAAYDVGVRQLSRRGDPQPIEGVGDRAVWIPDIPQLTVRSGDHVFHLHLHFPDGDRDDLAYARELARRIIALLE